MKPGETVRVTGYPKRYEWMAELVGKVGKVHRVVPARDGAAICVDFGEEGFVYFGSRFLEPAERVKGEVA